MFITYSNKFIYDNYQGLFDYFISCWLLLDNLTSSDCYDLSFYFLITNYTFAAIFVDQKNIIHGMREGFRISFRLPGQANFLIFARAYDGNTGTGRNHCDLLSSFCRSSIFPGPYINFNYRRLVGTLLLLLFSPFPLILFTSTLFYRYVEVVKNM